MIRYIDRYKNRFGVENICTALQENLAGGFITSRGYRAAKARVPAARTLKDQLLIPGDCQENGVNPPNPNRRK